MNIDLLPSKIISCFQRCITPNSMRVPLAALCSLSILLSAAVAEAQSFSDPQSVLPKDVLNAFSLTGLAAENKQIVSVENQPFTQAIQLRTPLAPASEYADGEYSMRLRAFTATPVTQGDVMLATFWARSVEPVGGRAYTRFIFEGPGPTFTKSANALTELTPTWQRFEIPFRAANNYAAREIRVEFWVGYDPQLIEIGGIFVMNYGPGNISDLPIDHTNTYEGRELDAAWRRAAHKRINKYRKGNFSVVVRGKDGRALPKATVKVQMRRHAFGFGSAVAAAEILGTSSDSQIYRDKIKELFNKVVMENDLKWLGWEGNPQRALNGVAWLRQQGIEVRGHTLVWPSWRNMPSNVKQLYDATLASRGQEAANAALRERIGNHVSEEAAALRGQLVEWDVLNEPYSNNDVQRILGTQEMSRWFQLAREADPEVNLYINDYGIYENRGWDIRHRNHYYNTIRHLIDQGAPLDGIGMQSHFGSRMTSPERLLEVLDQFAAFGKMIQVTEFDINTTDSQLQADYTRDFMTTLFSHPSVNGIIKWGFWEGRHWLPNAAMYRRDWTIKPNGEVWNGLVFKHWWTNMEGTTDDTGRYKVRGFLGEYEVEVSHNGVTKTFPATLPRKGLVLKVTLAN